MFTKFLNKKLKITLKPFSNNSKNYYMIQNFFLIKYLYKAIFFLFLLMFIFLFINKNINALNCEKIYDIDEKAKCYEQKIEQKQQEYKSTATKLAEIQVKKDDVANSINSLLGELNVTKEQIDQVQVQIDQINIELSQINDNLQNRKQSIQQKTDIRNLIIRNYAKEHRVTELELFYDLFLSNNNDLNSISQSFGFAKFITNNLNSLIYTLNQEINNFEKDKNQGMELKKQMIVAQDNLMFIKNQLDSKRLSASNELNVLGKKEEDFVEDLEDLEKEISELSIKQQAILQSKGGEFSASLSEGVESDDPRSSASFNPSFSPAFGFFSYGAYTHRNGMSQYGAKGRAEEGQDYKEILNFYYKTSVDEVDDLDKRQIKVEGFGTYSMQEYLYGLGEMPASWPMDALKAQAIAARTYAFRYLKNKSSICATTNCQYFHNDLINGNSRDRWRDAVDETKNMILKGDVTAQYSSTTGGWINNIGWDTSQGVWPNDAYEKKAGSPWFYKAWFTQNYNKNSSTCKRSSPWLNSEETADILNAYVLLKEGKNTQRVVPETINECPINGISGNPYSKSELREKAKNANESTGFKHVTEVIDLKYDTSKGKTTYIKFKTDKGEFTVSDAQLFSEAFNIRAPGYVAIKHTPDSKALFDILQK